MKKIKYFKELKPETCDHTGEKHIEVILDEYEIMDWGLFCVCGQLMSKISDLYKKYKV